MAFDPVRDAILNSPERTSYSDPFDDEDGNVNGHGHGHGNGIDAIVIAASDFKAPPVGFPRGASIPPLLAKPQQQRSSSSSSSSISPSLKRQSSSPDRAFAHHNIGIAETPGGLGVPPTPGSAITPTEYGQPLSAAPASSSSRPGTAHRNSSIFSLLSPEPPLEDENGGDASHDIDRRAAAATTDTRVGLAAEMETQRSRPGSSSSAAILYDEPEQVKATSSSRPVDPRMALRPSLVLSTGNGRPSSSSHPPSSSSSSRHATPASSSAPSQQTVKNSILEPVKRGRPYAPFKRVNGPPPASLYVPITPEELAFYRNPANSKNPLREGVQTASRSPLLAAAARESFRQDAKGKTKAHLEPPDDVDISPLYIEPSPLPPALVPGPIARQRPDLIRNGSSGPISPVKKRKRDSIVAGIAPILGEGVEVAAHYNKRLNYSRDERNCSPIIGLKSFNNWVKSVLIAKYARDYHRQGETQLQPPPHGRRPPRQRRTLKVLDLGCGKGGDLMKWEKANIKEYVGVDIAEVSIQQARQRWEDLKGRPFDASFFALDCYSNPLTAAIPTRVLSDPDFDVVSMQFCMHYAFQSVSKARMMLENVSRYLRRGGTFIGTIPDSEQLLARLKELPPEAYPLEFGNEVYRIVFDDRSKFPAFGHRYTFYLADAVEDVPEYVVQWDAFTALAAEYNLQLLYHATFHEVFSTEREDPEFGQLMERMRVVTPDGESELTEDQWEAATFAFIKI